MARFVGLLSLLALSLAVAPASAIDPRPAAVPSPAPVAGPVEAQVPGSTAAAAFVNFERLFALYGEKIKVSSWYRRAKPAIDKGFPDPAKDVSALGVVVEVDVQAKPRVGVVAKGSISQPRLMAWAQSLNLNITPSMYHGVSLFTAPYQRRSNQVGFVNDSTTTLSVDDAGEHQLTKSVVATLEGTTPSYSTTYGVTLPKTYIGHLSIKMTDGIRAIFDTNAMEPFRHLEHVKVDANADEASHDVSLDLEIVCDDAAHAAWFNTTISQYLPTLAAQGILTDVHLSLTGVTLRLQATIKRDIFEKMIARS